MAETVLSMTRSTLSGAVKIAASAAAAEMGLLIGVRKDIWFIKDELETMQAFLEVAEAMKKKDVLLKVWAKQVRDLSYNIEDCLGEFMVHVGSQSLSQRLMKLKDRHRIAMQIRDLKSRVEEVSVRNTRYSLIKMEPSSPSGEVDSYVEDVRNHSASNIDEAELVGFSKRKEKLIELMDVNSKNGIAKVICVVGMGGLGKTTLAMKTYENKEDIVKNFSCCAWITVSQTFLKIEMLRNMIVQLLGAEALKQCLSKVEGKTVKVDDLALYLREQLDEKRYLIVLDDLWTIEDWKWIKSIALPSSNNKGSRIIVTTRDAGLASQVTGVSLIYHLKALKEVEAKDLLLRKTTKTQKEIDNDKNLKELVEQLVKKCGGLPLAILTIGGILANKKIAEWRDIYNQLPSELDSSTSLDAMRRMVTLSYNHLPSHLKSCFLYLSIFPEDFEIQRTRLVERWIAEGFVREKGGVNIEDVGKSYFNELINRSMIIPSRVNIEGSVKSCRVHDIMRDVMVSISRDENFVYLAGGNMARVAEENFRHVAFHGSKYQNIGMDWSHIRSLTVFSERPMKPIPSFCSPQLRMLRVLDLQDTQFNVTQKDIKNIGLLLHLRYVNVQGCATIYALPRSIGKLQGLESLCITDSHITTLPIEISKLKSLRSIRCSNVVGYKNSGLNDSLFCMMAIVCCMPIVLTYIINLGHQREGVISELHNEWSIRRSRSGGVRVPRGIRNLEVLQILEVVDIRRTSNRAIKELGELVQLRKLRVTTFGATKKKCKILSAAVEKLSSLCSLCVDATTDGSFVGALEWVHSISSPPPLLRSLKLFGYLGEMPDWVGSLMHLVKISLQGSLLEDNKIMEILGALPDLMLLRLYRAAYVGEKLVFRAGAFPNLRKLQIGKPHILISDVLREVRFEKDASPRMERIQITACRLESGIVGIEHLPRLKGISLSKSSRVAKLGVLQGEVDAHPNNPILRLYHADRGRHDLGDMEGSNVQVEVEATGETCVAGERSQVVISTTNVSEETNVEVEVTEETSAVGGNSQVVISTTNVSEATNVQVEATEETSAMGERSQVVISTTNVSEATNVEVEATEETSALGESSQVVISTTNISEDDLFYTYNSC